MLSFKILIASNSSCHIHRGHDPTIIDVQDLRFDNILVHNRSTNHVSKEIYQFCLLASLFVPTRCLVSMEKTQATHLAHILSSPLLQKIIYLLTSTLMCQLWQAFQYMLPICARLIPSKFAARMPRLQFGSSTHSWGILFHKQLIIMWK